MKISPIPLWVTVLCSVFFLVVSTRADAYVGPAVGIGLIGALIGFVSVLGIIALGTVRWVFISLLSFGKRRLADSVADEDQDVTDQISVDKDRQGSVSTDRFSKIRLRLAYVLVGLGLGASVDGPRDFLLSAVLTLDRLVLTIWDPATAFHAEPGRFPPTESTVVQHVKAEVWEGLNLEVSAGKCQARLLDMEGLEIHKWHLPCDTISRAWSAKGEPLYDLSGSQWRRVKALRNGDLLVVLSRKGANPYGLGLLLLDWNSRVQWMMPDYYHHDVDVGPDDQIFTLYQKIVAPPVKGLAQISKPFLNEGVAILTSDGKEVRRIGIVDAFIDTPFEGILKLAEDNLFDDPLHISSVSVVTKEESERSNIASEGQLLVSIRNINTVAVIDLVTEKVVWADSGLWNNQHEPVLTRDDGLLIFDNLGPVGGHSRAVEWDMATRTILWEWSGVKDVSLKSRKWGAISLLPNDNRLISESTGGRAIEVTRDGRVVWEWRSDHRYGESNRLIGRLMEISRLPLDYFVERDLSSPKI